MTPPNAHGAYEAGEREVALTARAKRFMLINRSSGIVSGEWLDVNSRKVTGPPETWVKKRYRFDNGQQVTLNEADLAGLQSINFEPRWRFQSA